MNLIWRVSIILLLGLVSATSLIGCKNAERKSIADLLREMKRSVTAKPRPEISNLPLEQRLITLHRDQCRDEYEVLQEFLNINPNISEQTRNIVVDYRDAVRIAYEYYDSFIESNEFQLTERELEQGELLLKSASIKMRKLGKFVDGKLFQ
ncbi:MAG: hypothetical protein AAFN77_18245 [Planctomycetota bacterium]